MTRHLMRRSIQAIPTLFGVTIVAFLLMQATPGDPISLIMFNPDATPEATEQLRRQLGLDQPALTQYVYWLIGNDWAQIDVDADGEGDFYGTRQGFLRGDLGQSIQKRRPVTEMLLERVSATLQLTLSAAVVGYLLGIGIGVLAAIDHRGIFDQFARVISVIGNAVPSFWLGLLLIMLFSVRLGILPMSGMQDVTRSSDAFDLGDRIRHMVMPVLVLSLGTIAAISRYTRTQVLEVLSLDYVRTARSKGLQDHQIYVRHVTRNALMPVATLIGPTLGFLLSGAVIIEQVFSWPGLGRMAVNAVSQRDYPVVMGTVVLGAILYVFGNLTSDVFYSWIDPRVRFDAESLV
ncbi:MAG: ABC transporter permease [Chloroflexi bacterium]|nr:ABC transporter permease [Chloroflexota bacterium]